jgi:hypothetical protein
VKALLLSTIAVLIATVLIWLGQLLGYWWLALIIGLLLGIAVIPARFALLLAALSGGLGWSLPLFYRSTYLPIGNTASMVGSILGLGSTDGWIIILLTVLLGILLCLSAAWVGITLRQVFGFRVKAI